MKKRNRLCHISRMPIDGNTDVQILFVSQDKGYHDFNDSEFSSFGVFIPARFDEEKNAFVPSCEGDVTFAMTEYNRITDSETPEEYFIRALRGTGLIETDKKLIGFIPVLSKVLNEMKKEGEHIEQAISLKDKAINQLIENYDIHYEQENYKTDEDKKDFVLSKAFIDTENLTDLSNFVSFKELVDYYGTQRGYLKFIESVNIHFILEQGLIDYEPKANEHIDIHKEGIVNFHRVLNNALNN